MKKTEVYFHKPIYVGQALLYLSKTLMFDFHYNYIGKNYGNKAALLFTDNSKMKPSGEQITHFVGLRAKFYSYRIEDHVVKKAKGIKKNVLKKEMRFDDYKKMFVLG